MRKNHFRQPTYLTSYQVSEGIGRKPLLFTLTSVPVLMLWCVQNVLKVGFWWCFQNFLFWLVTSRSDFCFDLPEQEELEGVLLHAFLIYHMEQFAKQKPEVGLLLCDVLGNTSDR